MLKYSTNVVNIKDVMLKYSTNDYNRYFFKILQKRFCSKKIQKRLL